MPRRIRPIAKPVSVKLDGEIISAELGEPLAATLIANDALVVARSPKFHRPRSPSCFRGGCDGCLARVDGAPNAMTCHIPATEGVEIETQNRLGSRETDLLRATDWFFPDGLNHHELFAGIPGIQSVMQAFARRVAGLGRLPNRARKVPRSERRAVDALVIGSGPGGMAAATALFEEGRSVEIVDDSLTEGGSLVALGQHRAAFSPLLSRFERAKKKGLRVRTSTTALGIYGDDVLIASEGSAELLVPKTLVFATGAHDGVLAFEGNDVPGVFSVRAAATLLAHGILVGDQIAIVAPRGLSEIGKAFRDELRALNLATNLTVVRDAAPAIRGTSRVRGIDYQEKGEARSLKVESVIVDAPRAPAFELAEQAGAELTPAPEGFVVKTTNGKIRDGVFAIGELAGMPIELQPLLDVAKRIAKG